LCSQAGAFPEESSRSLFAKRKFADVIIRCEHHAIEANACVLAASPVFEKILQSPMMEGNTRVIQVDDFSASAVEGFLEILYTGTCSSAVSWGDVLRMADKYQLDGVVKICLTSMLSTLSVETVVPYIGALNNVSHLEDVKSAKEEMLNKVESIKELLRKLADAV